MYGPYSMGLVTLVSVGPGLGRDKIMDPMNLNLTLSPGPGDQGTPLSPEGWISPFKIVF